MTAIIHPFPSARHRKVVEAVAQDMAACVSLDSASDLLVGHVEIRMTHLELAGVDEIEIDRDARDFARAAFRRYQQLQHGKGAA